MRHFIPVLSVPSVKLPSGALGLWYADQYAAAPRPYVPNAIAANAPGNSVIGGSRRLFNNTKFWAKTGLTVVDSAATSPDGTTQAATFAGVGASNWDLHRTVNLTAGTYTIVAAVMRNGGSDQTFKLQIDGGVASGQLTATSAYQRSTFTATIGAGAKVLSIKNDSSSDAALLVDEINLFRGSADLGTDALNGHMFLGTDVGDTTAPTYASGAVDLGNGGFSDWACIQFPADLTFANAVTVIAVASQTGSNNDYPSFVAAQTSGTDDLVANFARNFESMHWKFKNTDSFINQKPTQLFNGKGFHLYCHRYDGASLDSFVDDSKWMQKTSSNIGTVTARDFFSGFYGGFKSNHKLHALALYNRPLSDAEVRQAYSYLKTRAARTGLLTLTTMDRVLCAEGDSITAPYLSAALQSYPYLFQTNASPFSYTVVRALASAKLNNNSGNSLVERATTVDAIIPPNRAGRKYILSVLIGANDLSGYTGGAAQYIADLAAYCDARRAAGWLVVICTLLPRTTALSSGIADATFNGLRATVNTAISTWVGTHADAVCDLAAVSGMGADSDCTNTSNYIDGWHPTAAGQILLEVPYRAAVNSL